jgi:hypothetical protein
MTNQEKKNFLWDNIVYNADNLTPEQVALGASIQPWEALEFCEDKLTDEQIKQEKTK